MVEGLLVLRVRDALGVDSGVQLGLRLRLDPAALVDHRDGDVTRLEASAAGSLGLVKRSTVHFGCL